MYRIRQIAPRDFVVETQDRFLWMKWWRKLDGSYLRSQEAAETVLNQHLEEKNWHRDHPDGIICDMLRKSPQ